MWSSTKHHLDEPYSRGPDDTSGHDILRMSLGPRDAFRYLPPYLYENTFPKESYHFNSRIKYSSNVHRISGSQKMEPLPQKEMSSLQVHLPITRVAAKALTDRNIPVVEYGQQIEWRCGDPVVLLVSNKMLS